MLVMIFRFFYPMPLLERPPENPGPYLGRGNSIRRTRTTIEMQVIRDQLHFPWLLCWTVFLDSIQHRCCGAGVAGEAADAWR